MTAVTKFKVDNGYFAGGVESDRPYIFKLPIVSGDAASGDTIELVDYPVDYMLTDGWLKVDGTLGASCTLKLQQGSTDLTVATTAGSANFLRLVLPMIPSVSERTLKLLVGGADIAADTTVWVLTRNLYLPAYSS